MKFNKDSVVLMGIDWSKAAKLEAMKDISTESPHIGRIIDVLDAEYRSRKSKEI